MAKPSRKLSASSPMVILLILAVCTGARVALGRRPRGTCCLSPRPRGRRYWFRGYPCLPLPRVDLRMTLTSTRRAWRHPFVMRALIMASATPAASTPRHSTSALEARSLRGLRHDAAESQVVETVSEAHALPPRFLHGRSDVRIHAVGCFHIGGTARVCMGASAQCRGHCPKARTGWPKPNTASAGELS
jgi:hypothetical protein